MSGFPRVLHTWVNPGVDHERYLAEAPAHIQANLHKAGLAAADPLAPMAAAGWQTTITRIDQDGTQVSNSTTEAIMVPDYTVPGGWIYGGKQLKYVIWGRVSTVVTTPGTITFRLRWGGVAGTVIMTSKAQRPKTTASVNLACQIEMVVHWRRSGTGGIAIGMGSCLMGNTIGDAAAAGEQVWPDAAAEVSSLNTAVPTALSPTIQFSVATSPTNFTAHIARLEDLT